MIQDILIPFLAIGVAELGDKTQLAVFCLASKTKRCLQLFLGVLLAFILADGLAVVLGSYITEIFPMEYIKIGSGIIFIAFGVFTLINHSKGEKKCEIKTPFASGFWLILFSEMGDKTQIASALFAARYNPVFVLVGVLSSLAVLSLMVIYLGRFVVTKINKKTVSIFVTTNLPR